MSDPSQIAARLAAIAPPWTMHRVHEINDAALVLPILEGYSDGGEGLLSVVDAEFIAHAPTDIAYLLAQRDAVLALHHPESIDLMAAACALGHCDHEDTCPVGKTVIVCAHCTALVEPSGGEYTEHPCSTVLAMGGEQ